MINKLDYMECMEYAEQLPGAEHTVLRSLEDLTLSDECVTCPFGENPLKASVLLSVKREDDGTLQSYYSTGKYGHSIIVGSTGDGKGQGHESNTLINSDGSCSWFVSDPKGEQEQMCGPILRKIYGDCVYVINFSEPEKTDYHLNYFDVLAKRWLKAYKSKKTKEEKIVAWNDTISRIRKYIDILFVTTSTKDPTWENTAKDFITAMIVALFEDLTLTKAEEKKTKRCRTTPEMINFKTVYKIFNSFNWGGRCRRFEDGGFLSARNPESLAYQYSNSIINNADNTRANYMGFVSNYLKEVNDPRIQEISAFNDFDIEALGKKPQVDFMVYDISDEALREYVNKNIALILNLLLESTHREVKPLDVPVRFYLDEFPTLKPNPVFPNLMATGRGSNIFLDIVIQSYTQLEARYPEEYRSMIQNADYTFFLGTNDAETAKRFSSELGLTTIPNPVDYLRGTFSTITVPVVSQDYLMHRMKEGEVFIKVHKRQPIHGFFEFFYKTPEYKAYPPENVNSKKERNLPNCNYDAPWMHPQDDEEDDDDDFFKHAGMRHFANLFGANDKGDNDEGDNTDVEDDGEDVDSEWFSDNIIEDDENELSLGNIYSADFDMATAISHVSNLAEKVAAVISDPGRSDISTAWRDEQHFEQVTMDLIEVIVGKDRTWERQEAIQEAAKELVAVRSENQSRETEDIHIRALREFMIASDSEYRLLRQQIFDE